MIARSYVAGFVFGLSLVACGGALDDSIVDPGAPAGTVSSSGDDAPEGERRPVEKGEGIDEKGAASGKYAPTEKAFPTEKGALGEKSLGEKLGEKLGAKKGSPSEKELVLEKEKELALEKEKQLVLEKEKELVLEKEKQLVLEKEKQLVLEKEKQVEKPFALDPACVESCLSDLAAKCSGDKAFCGFVCETMSSAQVSCLVAAPSCEKLEWLRCTDAKTATK